MPTAASRTRTLLVLLAVLATAAAACSSSTPNAAAPVSNQDVAKDLAKQLTDSKLLDAKTADCIGNRVAPALSASGRKLSKSAGASGVADLSGSDKTALAHAFDACMTAAQLAAIIAAGTAGATSGAGSPVTACLTTKLAAQYPTSGGMFESLFGKAGQSALLTMMSSCGLPNLAPTAPTTPVPTSSP